MVVAGILWTALASNAHADEVWSCATIEPAQSMPLLINYRVIGSEMIETWASGGQTHYLLVQNNSYGLVGVSSISMIELNKKVPTVGARVVAINRETKEFWIAGAITGESKAVNAPAYGNCIKS